ncbi:MAG TPA: nuclear transport factor 2 family protein [Candidatus Aquilonibacter sp.]|jgi:ketosteroid isomerase-like protein|nr:nuclear transport factor 2 family protein [Candidatus Aquilonibacter sp.]
MGKRVIGWGILYFLTLLAGAQEDVRQNAGSKILAVESVWNQAEARGDIKALSLIFDESLVYVDEDGTLLTKAQFLARVKSAGSRPQSLVTPDMNVQVYGETAVVSGTYHVIEVEKGKPLQRNGRFTDIWIYRFGVWLCVAAQATPISR